MNVYEEIEECYFKYNFNARLDKFIRRCFFVISVVGLIALFSFNIFGISIGVFWPVMLFFPFFVLSCVVFILVDYRKNNLGKRDSLSFYSKIKKYLVNNKSYKDEMVSLVNILKNNNVKTQSEIEFLCTYYRNKKSISIKNSSFMEFISLSLSISAIFATCYEPEKDVFQALPLMLVLGLSFAFVACFIRYLLSLWGIRDENFYSSIESRLTHIYLNFDEFFSNKKVLKKSKIKGIKL